MELYFLRHAIAADRGDPRYKDDSQRPLTTLGKARLRRSIQGIRRLGLKFDTVLSSPYVRAYQTAELVRQGYKLETKIHLTDNLLPPAGIDALLKEIRGHFPRSKHVVCVGHEPHLTQMISELLKSHKPLNIDFKKGGLCHLSIDEASKNAAAILNWLLTPAQMAACSKKNNDRGA